MSESAFDEHASEYDAWFLKNRIGAPASGPRYGPGSDLNLILTGSFEGGRMVLSGERKTEEGIVVDRIT